MSSPRRLLDALPDFSSAGFPRTGATDVGYGAVPAGEAPPDQRAVLTGRLADAERTIHTLRQYIRRLEEGGLVDQETGVFDLRGFIRQFHRELAAAQRAPAMNGVLVLVQVLASREGGGGGAPGAASLIEVARFLNENVRAYDVVGRVCHTMFAVLMTRTCNLGGRHRARKLIEALNGRVTEAALAPGPLRGGGTDPLAGLHFRAAVVSYNRTMTVDRAFGEARKALCDAWEDAGVEDAEECSFTDCPIADQLPSDLEIRFLLAQSQNSS